MTVSSSVNKVTYSGNSATTVFPVNYYFLENSHLQVILVSNNVETIQTITSQYTVTGAGNPAGGSVTMLTPPPTGTQLIIVRNVPATQETDYLANDPFPAESHERALDKLTMLVQQVELDADRALKIPLSSLPTTSTELPVPSANKLLAWNSNASAVTNFDPSSVISIVGQQASFSNVFTGNGVTVNFTLDGTPGNANAVDVSINGVTQVPNVDYILNGDILTFTTAPPQVASQILARYSEVFTETDGDASNVRYLPAGNGAVITNVQAKLRESVSVKDFGAVGDASTDDTAAIQAAITYAVANDNAVILNEGEYKITSPITISSGVAIFGKGIGVSRLLVVGCNAFNISAGVTFVTMMDFTIAHASRYTVSPNTDTAINITGTTASQCYWHTYQNLFIDGFEVGFSASGTSSTAWNNVTTAYTHQSVNFSAQCLNNTISQCRFGESDSGATVPAAGSFGIKVGDGLINPEGLFITDTLIFGVHRAVWIRAAINVYIQNNIFDMCNEFGVLAESTASAGCINNQISGNYIAIVNTAGDTGIYLVNNYAPTDSQNRGTIVRDNEILAYPSSTVNYGIFVNGTSETRNLISGNRVQNTTVYDCAIQQGSNHRVSDNLWRSAGGFYATVPVSYINNIGIVLSTAYPSPIGDFTPVAIGTTSAGTGTYSVQLGSYKIIDKVCYFNLRLTWSAHTGTGDIKIANLPVACKNLTGYAPAVTVNVENMTFPAGATAIVGLVNTAAATIELRGAGTALAPTPVALDTAASVNISGFYEID